MQTGVRYSKCSQKNEIGPEPSMKDPEERDRVIGHIVKCKQVA